MSTFFNHCNKSTTIQHAECFRLSLHFLARTWGMPSLLCCKMGTPPQKSAATKPIHRSCACTLRRLSRPVDGGPEGATNDCVHCELSRKRPLKRVQRQSPSTVHALHCSAPPLQAIGDAPSQLVAWCTGRAPLWWELPLKTVQRQSPSTGHALYLLNTQNILK